MSAAEANRRYYEVFAPAYEQTEGCVFGAVQQRRFLTAIDQALSHLGPHPSALDACGGSGNAAGALAARGLLPVLVDVSPDMVELWRDKATALGITPETHVAPIEAFLTQDPRSWDLITFCSALHHLEDYQAVVDLAAGRLTDGGVIFIMFDPTPATPLTRSLRRWDWALHLMFTQPRTFVDLARKALRRGSPEEDPAAYVGRLAERHAYDGIDDVAMRRHLESRGMRTLIHERYVDARLAPTRAVLRRLGRPSYFHLLVQNQTSSST